MPTKAFLYTAAGSFFEVTHRLKLKYIIYSQVLTVHKTGILVQVLSKQLSRILQLFILTLVKFRYGLIMDLIIIIHPYLMVDALT